MAPTGPATLATTIDPIVRVYIPQLIDLSLMLLDHLVVSEGHNSPTAMHSLVPAVLRCARLLLMQLVLDRRQTHIIRIALNQIIYLHLEHSLPLAVRHVSDKAARFINPITVRASLGPELKSCTICPNLLVELRADTPIDIVKVLMGQSDLPDRAIGVEVGVVEKGLADGLIVSAVV